MSVLLFLGFSTAAIAEPITILGINVAMSPAESEKEATSRGYSCETFNFASKWDQLICKNPDNGSIKIDINRETNAAGSISFSCETTNTCKYMQRDTTNALVQGGVVPESIANEFLLSRKYIGPEGDRLVLINNAIMIMRDKFGEAANFD